VTILVLDVGTSGVRAALVDGDAAVHDVHYREVLPSSPAPGFVEFDAAEMAAATLDVARAANAAAAASGQHVDAVGITNQRASTIVWDRATGTPVGPGVGWQDLRTAGMCLMLREQGLRLAPNVSATKAAFLFDLADPDRTHDLCFGTVDTWVAWTLSEGRCHVTDLSNAAVTGLVDADGRGWSDHPLEVLRIPRSALPEIVDSSGVIGNATALDGAPPITGIAGDQQASLIGQGGVYPGIAKITFGTGGMLDLVVGAERPRFDARGPGGTFPIVASRRGGAITWGLEAIMLSAGTNVEWLRDDLEVISTAAESDDIAASCSDADGVTYVPALLGLGTPYWDFGARGTLLGLTRGSTRAHVVRAVLEGIAQRGADLVDAAEADSGMRIDALRVDGGMSANATFVQALADAIRRPVEVSPMREATTLGAGFLAGLATGQWSGDDEIAATWHPARVVEPGGSFDRDRWREACRRASGWVPDLSAIDF
jgi:glycerol kinase